MLELHDAHAAETLFIALGKPRLPHPGGYDELPPIPLDIDEVPMVPMDINTPPAASAMPTYLTKKEK